MKALPHHRGTRWAFSLLDLIIAMGAVAGILWVILPVTPKLLFCPADRSPARRMANGFAPPASPGNREALEIFGATKNLRYFVGRDAAGAAPQSWLIGDDHLSVAGAKVEAGSLSVTTNTALAWQPGRHQFSGLVGRADGSVTELRSGRLRSALRDTGLAAN